MSALLFIILIPSIIVPLVMYRYYHSGNPWVIAIQIAVGIGLTMAVWAGSRYSMMADVEHFNGQVTSKERDTVSCSHSYLCNCRTVYSGSGKNRTSRRKCDTCYDHRNDYDWDVKSTAGNFTIDRVDRQGRDEPQRWSIVKVGDPVTRAHQYTNYVQAAPDSLFNLSLRDGRYKGKLPAYPGFYDYQYSDRVIASGFVLPDAKVWNHNLAMALRELGPKKQSNIVIVMTGEGEDFAEALRVHWLGGKKNDVLIIMGTNYPAIKWVRVYSWAQQDIVNVALRSALLSSKTLDPNATINTIAQNVDKYYIRKPMKDFEYLADEIEPSIWVVGFAFLFGLAACIGVGVVANQKLK